VRRRITVAILAVVIGTLVLTVLGSLLLVRRSAITNAENEVTAETQTLATLMAGHPEYAEVHQVDALRRIGDFDRLRVVRLAVVTESPHLPPPLTPSVLDAPALQAGQTVTGNVGGVVFTASPLTLAGPVTSREGPFVLIATRTVTNPVNGVGYFVLVAGVVLVAGIVVAALLARRLSAPVVRAVAATRQIADGNLHATVPVDRRETAELAALADAINTLGANLARARGLEREFLLSVSHELRTPLTSIRGYVDAIAEGATDDVPGALAIIGSESRRLERLVQDLLDLARLQARQFSLHPQRVDTAELLRAGAEGFTPGARAQAVTVALEIPEGPGPFVVADPDRLSQVVANLVENAVKFAAARVDVGVRLVGGWVAVWVTDDGPGVRAEDLPRIFERHFASDRVGGRRAAGTGLGLAIVAELASAMGGTVDAQSPVGEEGGTRMVVWLRAAADGGVAPPSPPPGGPTSALPLHPPV
jgi:signal transduction histidine kinase